MDTSRKIIHIDMDAFFAAVEQRDNPELRGKPVIVGGRPESRGVVSTCSYEARKYGIHSGMASRRAYKLCPHGIFVHSNFGAYREASDIIRQIFAEYTDIIEPLSLDEAFLDVTVNHKRIPSATIIAKMIRKEIYKRTKLTASAGVSYCKFIAKVASDINKPNGLTVVTPAMAEAFLEKLPIGKFYGIGKVTEAKMKEHGINTGADLKKWSRNKLIRYFGKAGEYYHDIVRGLDDRPVGIFGERKSLSKERTFGEDILDIDEVMDTLLMISQKVSDNLKKKDLKGKTVTIKVRYADFTTVTRASTIDRPVCETEDIMKQIRTLLSKTQAGKRKIRLLGVGVSSFTEEEKITVKPMQLHFSFQSQKQEAASEF